MNRPLSALAGGATGVTVMSLLLLLLEVETREQVGVFDAVARFVGVPGNTFLGFVLFLAAGTVAWPLLFVAVESYLPFDDPPTKGMVLGVVLWVPFAVLGRGELSGPLLAIFAAYTLISHLAYGFSLGAVYARFADERDATSDQASGVEPGA